MTTYKDLYDRQQEIMDRFPEATATELWKINRGLMASLGQLNAALSPLWYPGSAGAAVDRQAALTCLTGALSYVLTRDIVSERSAAPGWPSEQIPPYVWGVHWHKAMSNLETTRPDGDGWVYDADNFFAFIPPILEVIGYGQEDLIHEYFVLTDEVLESA